MNGWKLEQIDCNIHFSCIYLAFLEANCFGVGTSTQPKRFIIKQIDNLLMHICCCLKWYSIYSCRG